MLFPLDEDLDILRDEARTASTPTRRAWAERLAKRITDLETARDNLTASMTWPTTTHPDEPRVDSDQDHVHLASSPSDCS